MQPKQNQINRQCSQFHRGYETATDLREFFSTRPQFGISFVGRSNVGKSSLINALFKNNLARVSKTPGRTREINVFGFQSIENPNAYLLYDLPGYGHAKVSKEMSKNWDELMSTFFEVANDQVQHFILQDARHPFQAADLQFLDYLKNFPTEVYLVLNKYDKLKTQKEKNILQREIEKQKANYPQVKKIFYSSIHNSQLLQKLESEILNCLPAS